ncbi:hypothetical protein K440DRAFT_644331 [Wilcoxina mikolae CBS 423.85]|nr:hypothetical protein K440DRAFT_644331 [Wilcoxina mikolae CBS 423.85]
MKFNAATILTVFLTSSLASAHNFRRIPALEDAIGTPTSNEFLEDANRKALELDVAPHAVGKGNTKRALHEECQLEIIEWTGPNCNGTPTTYTNVQYGGFYWSIQENHSLELKNCGLDPEFGRLWLKGKTCNDDLKHYVYSYSTTGGCARNLPSFTCVELRKQPLTNFPKPSVWG